MFGLMQLGSLCCDNIASSSMHFCIKGNFYLSADVGLDHAP